VSIAALKVMLIVVAAATFVALFAGEVPVIESCAVDGTVATMASTKQNIKRFIGAIPFASD
jgi:hypothetical protein